MKKMIKVKIYNENSDEFFESEMPKIPEKGDTIGCWFEKCWHLGKVSYLVYEFDEDNKFLLVELMVNLQS